MFGRLRLAWIGAVVVSAIAPATAAAQADPYEDEQSSDPPRSAAAAQSAPSGDRKPGPSEPVPDRPSGGQAPASRKERPLATPAAAAAVPKVKVRYVLEGIELRGNVRTAARVVLRYVTFRAGDLLDVEDPEVELTRYRLLGTGFFASVQLSLRKGSRRGAAILVIDVVERNTFIFQNLWAGIAADEDTAGNARPLSAYLGVQVAETNLAGLGMTLGAGVALAADQFAVHTQFLDPAIAGTGWSAAVSLQYSDARDFFGNRDVSFESPLLEQREVTDYAVVAYRRFGATLGTGHDLTVSTQFALDYHLEQIDATVPTVASHLYGTTREPIDFSILGGKSVLSSLRAVISHDTRDAPFLTKHGMLASVSLAAGIMPLGSDYSFARMEASLRHWWQLPWKHVVRAEAFAGFIAGSPPFFEKFYAGDFTDLLPDRILSIAPDRRQPPNFLGNDIIEVRYGEFAAKIEGEYRIPLYVGRDAIYGIDLFGTTGLYSVATRRQFTDPPSGYDGAARVPLDVTFNLGLRVDTKVGGISLAFSNLLGLIPARRGVRK